MTDESLTPLPAEAPWLLRWLAANWNALTNRLQAYIAVGVITAQTLYQTDPDFRNAVTPAELHWWTVGFLIFSAVSAIKRKEVQ